MDFSEIQERYLRPRALAENIDHSTWSDEAKVWVKQQEAQSNQEPLFLMGSVLKQEGEEVEVKLFTGQKLRVRASDVHATNAARYDRYEDMAQMGELNEPCVLDILKNRYASNLIYVSSCKEDCSNLRRHFRACSWSRSILIRACRYILRRWFIGTVANDAPTAHLTYFP